jgi:predicted permease
MPFERWLRTLPLRFRSLFRRSEVEQELDDEIRDHIERQTAANISAGMAASNARTAALREFGGVERRKEEVRDTRGVTFIEHIVQDALYAARGLRRSPGFTLTVVVTLGLGIGANTVMFSVIDRMFLRTPPLLRDAGLTHRVYTAETFRGHEDIDGGMSYPRFVDLTKYTTSFSRTAEISNYAGAPIGEGADARMMNVASVTSSFFGFFAAPPLLGRYYSAEEETPSTGKAVAVLSYAFWQSHFAGRRDVLGSMIDIGPARCTIIGVAPAGFVGVWPDDPPAAYLPIPTLQSAIPQFGPEVARTMATNYNRVFASMIVQRKPGVTVEAANADLRRAMLRSYAIYRLQEPHLPPAAVARPRAFVASILQERGPDESDSARIATWVSGVALVVLLIACATVANLLLSRAMQRRREIAVRLALGVTRIRLLSQLLTESVLLALCGAVAGLLVARWGSAAFSSYLVPSGTSPTNIVLDARALVFTSTAALVVGIVSGLVPVFQTHRIDLTHDLKSGARDGTYRRSRTRVALLLFQGALSMVLLVGAGLFVRSLAHVRAVPLGYDIDPVLRIGLEMRGVDLDSADGIALRQKLLEAAHTIPAVEHASRQLTSPFWRDNRAPLFLPGTGLVRSPAAFHLNAVTPEYFATMGIRVLRGRSIADQDRDGAPGVMVVNDAMAKELWPGKEPIGECVKLNADTAPCRYVVGVVENTRAYQLSGDDEPMFYMPASQWAPRIGDLVVRVRGRADRWVETIRRRLQREMPGNSYVKVVPMSVVLADQARRWAFGATMFALFGLLALVIAAVGLYSVIAYNVVQRTHEFGVRVALGAQSRDVAAMTLGQGLRVSVVGALIGSAIALWAGRFVRPLLFEESPRDPVVFGVVAATLLMVATLASLIPARRATRVDPVRALRAE